MQKAFFSENYIAYINIYENEFILDIVLDKSIISTASYLFK